MNMDSDQPGTDRSCDNQAGSEGSACDREAARETGAQRAVKDGGDPSVSGDDLAFYEALATSSDFARFGADDHYAALPDGWFVGVADLVRSTQAIQAGHYKVVNTVAAAAIAGVANGLKGRDFPFVFGGDGCGFALPGGYRAFAERVLSAVAGWARDAFGLTLRIAIVPIGDIRAAGKDVRLARYSPSPDVAYAMFAGGGMTHAEERMKAGEYRLQPAVGDNARPDLDGLYCRFSEIPARHGVILSIVVLPGTDGDGERFAALSNDILAIAGGAGENGNPVPEAGPKQVWPPKGLEIEVRARAARTAEPLWRTRISVLLRTFLAHLTFLTRRVVGEFDPERYTRELVRNTDFRKFDDGLRMTLDCTLERADQLEALLADARTAGVARVGTHRQDASLMTCFVPSSSRSDHVHFVDGAMGGYAAAAAMASTSPVAKRG